MDNLSENRLVPHAHIEYTSAKSFKSPTGEYIPSGKAQTRIVFQGFENKKLAVAARTTFNEGSYFKGIHETGAQLLGYVKLHFIDDQNSELKEVMISIDDLAQRYGLSKDEIVEASNKGQLESLLRQELMTRVQDVQSLPATEKAIHRESASLAKRYNQINTSRNIEPDLTTEDLSKIVQEGLTEILINNQGFSSEDGTQMLAARVSVNEQDYLVGRDQQNNLYIVQVPTENEYLGEGDWGRVYATRDPFHETPGVLKEPQAFADENLSCEEHLQAATRLLKNEGKILHKLWQDESKNIEGLQHAPFIVLETPSTGPTAPSTFIYTQRYSGSSLDSFLTSEKFQNATQSQRLQMACQGLNALSHMEKHQIVNGDIKAGNIFIDEDRDGNFILRIGDFGGAVDLSEQSPGFFDHCLTATSFIPQEDEYNLISTGRDCRALSLISSSLGRQAKEEYNKVQYARDTATLTVQLVHLLTGKQTYRVRNNFLSSSGIPSFNLTEARDDSIRALKEAGYPEAVVDVFEELLNPDYAKRLSPQEARERLIVVLKQEDDRLDKAKINKAAGG